MCVVGRSSDKVWSDGHKQTDKVCHHRISVHLASTDDVGAKEADGRETERHKVALKLSVDCSLSEAELR